MKKKFCNRELESLQELRYISNKKLQFNVCLQKEMCQSLDFPPCKKMDFLFFAHNKK